MPQKRMRTFSIGVGESAFIDEMTSEMDSSPDAAIAWTIRIAQIVYRRIKDGNPIDLHDHGLPSKLLEDAVGLPKS